MSDKKHHAPSVQAPEKHQRPIVSDVRDGNWLDRWGACRVCDGEIPYGHDPECDVHKMQQEIRMLREANAQLVASEQSIRNECNRLRGELRKLAAGNRVKNGARGEAKNAEQLLQHLHSLTQEMVERLQWSNNKLNSLFRVQEDGSAWIGSTEHAGVVVNLDKNSAALHRAEVAGLIPKQ